MFYTIDSIAPICQKLRESGSKLVLATGFFDLLHQEHLNFLTKAKAAGDILIVGVESDARARKLKGDSRPIETQIVRCSNLTAYADYTIALPDDFDHYEAFDALMSSVRPNIFAVSSHTLHQDKKAALTEKYGGSLLVVHDFNADISTTKIINQNHV